MEKSKEKIMTRKEFERVTSGLQAQHSTNWAIQELVEIPI